jgi:hypothetical protein
LTVTVFWVIVFIRHSVTNYTLYWLPAVDLLGCAVTWYLDNDIMSSFREVEKLANLKYDFKKI